MCPKYFRSTNGILTSARKYIFITVLRVFYYNMILLLLLCGFVFEDVRLVSSIDSEIDPAECQIWGPGLFPDQVVMPARYFYIQAVDRYKHK